MGRLRTIAVIMAVIGTATTSHAADLDLTEMTVDRARAGFAEGTYSVKQLTEAFLARIARYNPGYNAIITLNPDAVRDAEAIDRRRAAGEQLGPLAGVPVVIKDTMDFAGLPSTGGWARLSARAGGIDLIPATDAPVIARLRAAGAIVLGKTNVPVLSVSGTNANDSWAGPTYNAADLRLAPGGSSAGTASAVAASFAVLGLGEETGGSIQNPAAAQGLVGIKPTFALVPNTGVMPLATSTRDVVGPIARTVKDAAIMLDIIAGYTAEDPKTVAAIGHLPKGGYAAALGSDTLRGKRIGLYGPGWRAAPLSAETQDLYDRAVAELTRRGAIVVADPFQGSGFADIARTGRSGYDARGEESVAHDLENYLVRLGPKAPARSPAELAALVGESPFAPGGVLAYQHQQPGFTESLADPAKAPDLSAFLAAREAYIATLNGVMDRQRIDALAFPQALSETPPLFGGDSIRETTTSEINIGGFPGITVPAGYYRSGAPFGLIFVGRLWDEARLLALAYDFEQLTKARKAPGLVENPTAPGAPPRR